MKYLELICTTNFKYSDILGLGDMTLLFDYKLLVLFVACLTQFIRGVFLSGSVSIYPLYYEQQYGERVMSAVIGSILIAVSYLFSKLC